MQHIQAYLITRNLSNDLKIKSFLFNQSSVIIGAAIIILCILVDSNKNKPQELQIVGLQTTAKNAVFEKEERLQLQKKCNCTSGKIVEVRKMGGKRRMFKYNVQTDKGRYSKLIEISRAPDITAIEKDSFFLVLISSDDYSLQRIFLNTPKAETSLDTFPSEIECRKAINDLSKKQKETPYIY